MCAAEQDNNGGDAWASKPHSCTRIGPHDRAGRQRLGQPPLHRCLLCRTWIEHGQGGARRRGSCRQRGVTHQRTRRIKSWPALFTAAAIRARIAGPPSRIR